MLRLVFVTALGSTFPATVLVGCEELLDKKNLAKLVGGREHAFLKSSSAADLAVLTGLGGMSTER